MGKILKTTAVVLSAVGGVAGTASAVINIAEQVNYVNVHEINVTDEFVINGEKVGYEEWVAFKDNMDSGITMYFGSSLSADEIDLDSLSAVHFNEPVDSYTCNIKTGTVIDGEYFSEYAVCVVPEEIELEHWSISNIYAPFSGFSDAGFNVYHLDVQTYDEDLGGTNHTFIFDN